MLKSTIRIFVVIALASISPGCSMEPSKSNTYPCDFGVYSKFPLTVKIIECKGIGNVYPSGLITKTSGLALSPSKTFFFPRQKRLPRSFVIRWKVEEEEHSQELVMPPIAKGSFGMLRLELSEANVWQLSFEKEK